MKIISILMMIAFMGAPGDLGYTNGEAYPTDRNLPYGLEEAG